MWARYIFKKMNISMFTNNYERKARLYPVLLLIFPYVASGIVLFLGNFTLHFRPVITIVIGCMGLLFLFTQVARDAGKKKEPKLFARWGGKPSVTIFRHRDKKLDTITKNRYHKKLACLIKDIKIPSIKEEEHNPEYADEIYSACSEYLRVKTRDQATFKLLFEENINYGYRRNVFGFRVFGIISTLIIIFVCIIKLYLSYQSFNQLGSTDFITQLHLSHLYAIQTIQLEKSFLIAGGISLFFFCLWVFYFSSRWVKIGADSYAKRLAESVELL